jgi:hypothetical protein
MTTKKTRTLRTPAERAIAALGVEQRRVEKLQAKREQIGEQYDLVNEELEAATRRRDYLAQNPDLPEANTDPIPGVDGGPR